MIKDLKTEALITLNGSVLAEKNIELYKSISTKDTKRPKSLDRKVQRNINKEKRRREFGTFYKYGQCIAVMFLAVCTVCFGAVMSVKAVREVLWELVVEANDDYLEVNYVPKADVQEIMPPTRIEEYKDIDLVGFDLEKKIIMKAPVAYIVEYYEDERRVLLYNQFLIKDDSRQVNNENTIVEEFIINGYSGLLVYSVSQQYYCLTWTDGMYAYGLEGSSNDFTKEEMMTILKTLCQL